MRRLSTIHRLGRAALLVGTVACLGALWFGAAGASAAAATIPPWSPFVPGGGDSWAVYDAYAFGSTSLAAVGDDGHIAVTRDAGGTWKVVVPAGHATTAFTAVALGTSGYGAVASGGLLLVTSDVGETWGAPRFLGPGPGAAINDIALQGSRFIAVGDDGMIIGSDDSGATWKREGSPTDSALTSVAIAGDGTAVAGSAAGEILVDDGGGFVVAGTASGPVTSVAAAPDPVWGDGAPDLIAASSGDVLGSDDALTFATLPGLPAPTTQPWSTVAWSGVPDGSLLIAGAQRAGYFEMLTHDWVSGTSGLGAARRAVAPAGQSVAYLLGADGSLARTLSAGREPAAATLGRSRIVVGQTTRLTATVRVGAPGKVLLRGRNPGRGWITQRTIAWTPADWSRRLLLDLDPRLTREYDLTFQYSGTSAQLTTPLRLVVAPKVKTTRSRYDLRVGSVYRFSGSVTPRLNGERVELYTDRGGSWRPISRQRSVKLLKGRTWKSRLFGTPKAETYRLRARIRSTSKHGGAWSRTVTVSIRR